MRLFITAFAILGATSTLSAQQIGVQQPVVENFGVSTTVSVPDRGGMFLGGVNSASSFRQSYGPIRNGTTRTHNINASSLSAHVYIIDLQAMDEALLNSVPDSPVLPTIRRSSIDRVEQPQLGETAVEKVAKFEKLAQQAESAGKAGVARLHWQMAAKYGSTIAQGKLNPPTGAIARTNSKN